VTIEGACEMFDLAWMVDGCEGGIGIELVRAWFLRSGEEISTGHSVTFTWEPEQ